MEKPKVRSKATLALLASLSILEVSFFLFISKIDGIVSGDLYNYGLQYSYEWAGQYWNAVSSFQFATLVSTILIIIALSSFLAYRNKRSSVLKKVCYLTIAFVIILNIFNIYFLENIDYIINHDLYLFQLTFSYNWANPYWSFSRAVLILIGLAITASVASAITISFSEGTPKIAPAKLAYWLMVPTGILMLIFASLYNYQVLALSGLGVLFWGIILAYVRTEDYTKKSLLVAATSSQPEFISQITEKLGYKGNATYLPPDYFLSPETQKVFIPKQTGTAVPPPEIIQTHEDKLVFTTPPGLLLTPPGASLSNLIEKTLGKPFTGVDLKYLQQNLPKVLVDELEIANKCEILTQDENIYVEIRDSRYPTSNNSNFSNTSQGSSHRGDSYLASALACALTKATGNPIVIIKQQSSRKGKDVTIEFAMISRQKEKQP